MTGRSERNRERWGTVQERGDAILAVLSPSKVTSIAAISETTGFSHAAIGGALSGLKQRKLVVRHGRKGWSAVDMGGKPGGNNAT